MRFKFHNVQNLPRLAWCVNIQKGENTVEVLHGPWVETAEHFFCEGAWSGDFPCGDFDTSLLMGSGGRVADDTLIIAAPNHTLERIFTLRDGKILWISNSLAFVLASANDTVHPRALLYSVKLASIIHGLEGYARSLPTRNGRAVRMHYHCNLVIDARLRIVAQAKRPIRDFENFADYKSFLFGQVSAIHRNATHPLRKIKYTPMATISAGYDSPAAAVLAQSLGCKEALTFAKAREKEDADDSGAAIGAQLGMNVLVFDRLAYLKKPGFPEAEFLGWGAQESIWEPHLEARVLFTGFHGDKVWDRNCEKVSTRIVRGDPSGHNLSDFRLRVGWIHLPVPFVGCTSHPSIHRISNSAEMAPWTLGNRYDRPIARRLVEEAGVERHLFAAKKRAVGLLLDTEGLQSGMTEASYHDYLIYYREHWNTWMTMKRIFFRLLREIYARHQGLNKRLERLLSQAGLRVHLPVLIPREFRISRYGNLGVLSLLPHWSIEKLLATYFVETRIPDGTLQSVLDRANGKAVSGQQSSHPNHHSSAGY